MDPFSALAIAAAVVQFADFGSRLVRDVRRVRELSCERPRPRDRRRPPLLAEMTSVAQRLKDHGTVIEDGIIRLEREKGLPRASEQALLQACIASREICDDLVAAVRRISPTEQDSTSNHDVFTFLSRAIRGARSKHDVDAISIKLAGMKEELVMAMIVCIWY
jgi:hypothetical protein